MPKYQYAARGISTSPGQLFDTLRVLVGREFRVRYKGSALGIIWAVLNPLGTVLVLQYVFTNVLTFAAPHFSAFMYSAMLPWVWFQSAVQLAASTMSDNSALVRTPFFSKPLLPWTLTCTNFLLYLFAMPVLLILILNDGLRLTPALFALPAIWIAQWILTLGFTVLIAAIGVLVRDIQHLMTVVLLFWFYLTPIFYDVHQVPAAAAPWFSYNPMTPIVTAHRAVTVYGQFPDWSSLVSVTIVGAVLFMISIRIFNQLEDAFIDET